MNDFIQAAVRTIEIEARSILELRESITESFSNAAKAILNTTGKVIVSGIGKSGHIGKKIAATLASTGTPSFFIHPSEAFHGDLGMIGKDDILLLISYSGETEEVLRLLPFLKNLGNTIISFTGRPESTLARNAHFNINVSVRQEACPLSLAPTSSTTATLVIGDALAIALMEARGFKPEDFARYHPGGSLGRRLLAKVKDFARYDNLPFVEPDVNVREVIYRLAEGRLGLVMIQNHDGRVGIITDGDFRRSLANIDRLDDLRIHQIVNYSPIVVDENTPIYQAEELMLSRKITTLLVSRNSKVVGVFQMFSLVNYV
ncbi:arabinose-5-phosphate isomerase [Thermaurantimonas aggregans]|uniref:Arabinose-5-phosphate isomerase n=1 Tax=Thermaurantimonas aggregans TaxID=2173829 RepID=A0A401XJX8_9FLAO|nr:KpsF/GutQ family sugar-phosphate isomerase [Thermaurantimonas aggregans]GCD77347.1 arabinose-5-phosphate isomerase [Thermaurantimonas aggregans]